MRRFVQRALNKLGKLDHQQLHAFIQEMAKENERLETLLDSLAEGIIVCDKTNTVLLVNKAAERLIPLDIPRFSERLPVWELVLDPQVKAFVRRSLLDPSASDEAEFPMDAGGKVRILSIRVGPLVSKGRIQGGVIMVQDISEKRRRETRLRRAESLAKLSTVAAGVAHEIKNPLGAISIHLQLIQRLLSSQPCSYPSDVNSYLGVITDEVERLNRIVVDFLFAVRPMDLQLIRGRLQDVVQEVLQFMAPELEQHGITLAWDPPRQCLPDILLDERYVKQALLNLLKNAVHAMDDGGTLTVRLETDNGQVCLSIRDTGVGMSAEVMEKVFEPFFTTKDFGSGIGLTLVYKIVREHGGEITVDSSEGQGACFTLVFPPYSDVQQFLAAPMAPGPNPLDPEALP